MRDEAVPLAVRGWPISVIHSARLRKHTFPLAKRWLQPRSRYKCPCSLSGRARGCVSCKKPIFALALGRLPFQTEVVKTGVIGDEVVPFETAKLSNGRHRAGAGHIASNWQLRRASFGIDHLAHVYPPLPLLTAPSHVTSKMPIFVPLPKRIGRTTLTGGQAK
jgi:hypothetical protein